MCLLRGSRTGAGLSVPQGELNGPLRGSGVLVPVWGLHTFQS